MAAEKGKLLIIGGTGAYLGQHVSRAACKAGHDVTITSRGRSARNGELYDELTGMGAKMVAFEWKDKSSVDELTNIMQGMDAVICFPGIDSHRSEQCRYLLAAKRAGVKRFVPDDFGIDIDKIPYGKCGMFDQKNDFSIILEASGVPYTRIFNNAISEWMIPTYKNQKGFVKTGTGDVPYLVCHKRDVAAMTVMCALDPRCANKGVSLNGCGEVTQNALIKKVQEKWPAHKFTFGERSVEEVLEGVKNGNPMPAKPGEQSEKERQELNKLVYLDGQCAVINDATLKATDLFPDYEWFTVDQQYSDPEFMFGAKEVPPGDK